MIVFLLIVIVAILLFGPGAILAVGGAAIAVVVAGTVLGIFGWHAILWTVGAIVGAGLLISVRIYASSQRSNYGPHAQADPQQEAQVVSKILAAETERAARIEREIEIDRQRARNRRSG